MKNFFKSLFGNAQQRLSEVGKQSQPPVRFSGGPGGRAVQSLLCTESGGLRRVSFYIAQGTTMLPMMSVK
jgi:hypothetical protein